MRLWCESFSILKIFEEEGFQAIGTMQHAASRGRDVHTMLCCVRRPFPYQDGNGQPCDLKWIVVRPCATTTLG